MTIGEIAKLLNADILSARESVDKEVQTACGSDLMSDVLAFVKNQSVLITGLTNAQSVRTSEMMDIACIVIVRGKTPTDEMIDLAERSGIAILNTDYSQFTACGILYTNGLSGGDRIRA
jgi:predicted transcriptional regulator